jgi:hypothetical protein
MERGSAKHGPRLDEEQKHETEGMVRGGGPTHAEEWKEPEPMPVPGEESVRFPPGHAPGTPEGITPEAVEIRSDLAKWLDDVKFPATSKQLLRHARDAGAPDRIVDMLRSLPQGSSYNNVAHVAEALGLGKEKRRW